MPYKNIEDKRKCTARYNAKPENKKRKAEWGRQYRKDNAAKFAASSAKRRAVKSERTVGWTDDLVIKMIYEDCPKGYQVDHIIPLRGEKVSGLHVAWNLQYLTAEENLAKGNKYDIPA